MLQVLALGSMLNCHVSTKAYLMSQLSSFRPFVAYNVFTKTTLILKVYVIFKFFGTYATFSVCLLHHVNKCALHVNIFKLLKPFAHIIDEGGLHG
jgi:hypothetical protein